MSSTHKVETFILTDLKKHPAADLLSIIKIADTDYTYVARTEDWLPRVGKVVAWVPPDSIVKLERPEFSFLKEFQKSGRIRAKKIRGVVSYGLLVLAEGFQPGEDAAATLEVVHYEPEIQFSKGYTMGSEVAPPPSGMFPKYDVDSYFKYGRKVFVQDEPVYVSEKIHGANGRYVFDGTTMYCGSRTEWKKEFTTPPNITVEELTIQTGSAERAKEIYEKSVVNFKPRKSLWWLALDNTPALRAYCEAHPGHAIYGEVFGNVQNMKYGAKTEVFFRAFDIMVETNWLDADEFIKTCDAAGLPRVPEVAFMPFDFDKVAALAEGPSLVPGAGHFREGVVVKPIKNRWDEAAGRVSLKVINPAYLEKN